MFPGYLTLGEVINVEMSSAHIFGINLFAAERSQCCSLVVTPETYRKTR